MSCPGSVGRETPMPSYHLQILGNDLSESGVRFHAGILPEYGGHAPITGSLHEPCAIFFARSPAPANPRRLSSCATFINPGVTAV